VAFVGLLGNHQTFGRVHEPAVVTAAGQTGVTGLVAEQCFCTSASGSGCWACRMD